MDQDSSKRAFDSVFPDYESQEAFDNFENEFPETQDRNLVSLDDFCLIHTHHNPTTLSECVKESLYASDLDRALTSLELEDELHNCAVKYPAALIPGDSAYMNQFEVLNAEHNEGSPNFITAVGPDTYPRSPPEMISNMIDGVNFDFFEGFDLDAAAIPNDQSETQSFNDPVLSGHIPDRVLPSGTSASIYSTSVDFLEYLRQSGSNAPPRNFKADALAGGRGQQIPPVAASNKGAEAHMFGSSTTNRNDNFASAFRAGAKDEFLPSMSDPMYDEELATVSAAGIKSNSRFSKEVQSGIHVPSSVAKGDNTFKRAGEIYVSYVIRRKIELSGKSTKVSQQYTVEEIKWARNYLSNEVKAWLRANCSVDATDSDWPSTIIRDDEQALHQTENAYGQTHGTQLPGIRKVRDANSMEHGRIYPDRMRLFSEELGNSFPRTSNQLEEFEDLPQNPNQFGINQSFETFAIDHEKFSTVRFSFINEGSYAAAVEKLETILMDTPRPELQNIRLWPLLSIIPSQSTGTPMFKVTAPKHVDLVTILREIFPEMGIQTVGKRAMFVEIVMENSNANPDSYSAPKATNATEAAAAKGKHKKQAETPVAKQPRRGCRTSTGLLNSTSGMTVKTKVNDGSAAPNKLRRQRSSSRISELRGEQDYSPPEKKRMRRNN